MHAYRHKFSWDIYTRVKLNYESLLLESCTSIPKLSKQIKCTKHIIFNYIMNIALITYILFLSINITAPNQIQRFSSLHSFLPLFYQSEWKGKWSNRNKSERLRRLKTIGISSSLSPRENVTFTRKPVSYQLFVEQKLIYLCTLHLEIGLVMGNLLTKRWKFPMINKTLQKMPLISLWMIKQN